MSNRISNYLFSFLRSLCFLALIFQFTCGIASARHSKNIQIRLPEFPKPADPNSTTLSPAAIQVATLLGIKDDLHRLEKMRKQITTTGVKPDLETRQNLTELKLDMIAAIEQARLDIDFVSAELEDEHARNRELYQVCNDEQTKRMVRANVNAFRTNGILWAVAESLDIPTYSHPKFSIPSGSIGIIAGIVPSLFSLYAARTPKERYSYSSYPNMLCKIFDYPITPRTEYPNSVWTFLNAKPMGEPTRSRKEIMIQHWSADKNIHCYKNLTDKEQLDLLTGTKQELISPDLLSDQLLLLGEVKAVVVQMNRALMELMMLVRGQKEF